MIPGVKSVLILRDYARCSCAEGSACSVRDLGRPQWRVQKGILLPTYTDRKNSSDILLLPR